MGGDEVGYKEHGGQFHVMVTATLTMLAEVMVVVSRRGEERETTS